MINDYEFIEHDEEYINNINMDKSEYNNIIINLLKKNKKLELINKEIEIKNKKNLDNFISINKKYLDTLSDFNNLNANFFQIEKDLYDMEIVNLELVKIIKTKND
jgi:hypothetical protein|tara:strand:- start:213 stop:527 length:315 start_codon:yes stop_codon:yes gene_type:complete